MTLSLSRRGFIATTAALSAAPGLARAASPAQREDAGAVNPLVKQRADAQIFRHDDGYYYMTGSVPEYDRLVLRRSRTLAGLATAREAVLWRHEASGPMSGFLWAPELHHIDGRWIMYFAAGPSGGGEDVFRIRTYAVACDGADPMTGTWSVLGQFQTPWDSFNLDSTVFIHRGVRYVAWAQREPGIETNSNLYLAPLATPLTLGARPARLTVPTLDWEIRGFKVAEAPAVLERNGRLFMTYSASATDARYCLGLLTAPADADIMNPDVWVKSPEPVFVTDRRTGVYGPGHNSFTVDEQGRDILVYHGRDYEAISGDPLFDPNRHTRIQRLYYKPDGTPDFGIPVGNGPLPERLSPSGDAGSFLFHDERGLQCGAAPSLPATQFRMLPTGDGAETVRLSPITRPDLRIAAHADGSVTLASDDGSPAFARRSQFLRVKDGATERFIAVAVPGKALAVKGNHLLLAPRGSKAAGWRID